MNYRMVKHFLCIIGTFAIIALTACGNSGGISDYVFHDIKISLGSDYKLIEKEDVDKIDDHNMWLNISDNKVWSDLYEDEVFVQYSAGAVTAIYCLNKSDNVQSVDDFVEFIESEINTGSYSEVGVSEASVSGNPAALIEWSELFPDGSGERYHIYTAFETNDMLYVGSSITTRDRETGELILDIHNAVMSGIIYDGEGQYEGVHKKDKSSIISWKEAAKHVGETVTVEGDVCSAGIESEVEGSPIFIDLGMPYPDESRFTIVIWEEYQDYFDKEELPVEGDLVNVTGEISRYNNICQVEISEPSQIEIVKH